jgi:methylmalonyl-CoA/ethylmalonyl-CoA epimerase
MDIDKKINLGNFPLTSLTHIGVIVKNIEETIGFLGSVWQIGKQDIFDYRAGEKDLDAGESFNVRVVLIKFGPVSIELLQPMDDKSVLSKFIEEKGEGIHHFSFGVSNYEEIVEKFKKEGHELLVAGTYHGVHWCYFRTFPGGIVIEFEEQYT